MTKALLLALLVAHSMHACVHYAAATPLILDSPKAGRHSFRKLLQVGTARFMNAPIINTDALEVEAGLQQQVQSKQPSKPQTSTVAAADTTPQQQQQQVQQKQPTASSKPAGQPRGLLGTDSRRRRYDSRWRRERLSRYRRYDRGTLSPLLSPVNRYSQVRPQALPALTGLLAGLLQPGNPRGTAQSLARAYTGGQADAAAQAVASAAAGQAGGQARNMAQALAEAAVSHPNVAPGLLAQSANLAVNRGQADTFANTLADAFGYAKQQQHVPQLTDAVCKAINTGGDAAKYASGSAIATAIAQGGDSKAAVAEATATALCSGGSTAQAWSSAYAVALAKDQNGCLVLNEARALAQAKCGDGAADAVADAEASSTVLGFCGLLEGFFPDDDISVAGSNSGSYGGGNDWGGANGWGQGNWAQGGWGH